MSQSSAEPDTIKFNIGGETFEVLEHTIRAKPDTLLCTLLDDPGQIAAKRGQQSDKSIFVEANAKLFPFILDWYRYGSILIPEHISLEQLKRECAFFQLPDEVRIKRDREPNTATVVSSACAKMRKIQDEVKKAKIALESLMVYEELMEQRLRTRGSDEEAWQASEVNLNPMKEILSGSEHAYTDSPSRSSSRCTDIAAKVQEYAAADGWLVELEPLYLTTDGLAHLTKSEVQEMLEPACGLSALRRRELRMVLRMGPSHVYRVTLQPSRGERRQN